MNNGLLLMVKPKCIVRNEKQKNRCSNAIIAKIIAQLYHPDTDRKSKQTFYICKEHLEDFLVTNGKGWYRWYSNEDKTTLPLIDYTIQPCIELLISDADMVYLQEIIQ